MAQAPCSALAQLQGRSLTFPSASHPTAIQRPGVAGVLESRQVRQRGVGTMGLGSTAPLPAAEKGMRW